MPLTMKNPKSEILNPKQTQNTKRFRFLDFRYLYLFRDSIFDIRISQQGFTLIELIVSIGILAILAGFVLAILNPFVQIQKGNDGRRKADLSAIQKGLEQYYQDVGRYPQMDNATYQIKDSTGSIVAWGKTTPAWQRYMSVLPKDPLDPGYKYVYFVRSDGQAYWLYAGLERGSKDADVCNGGQACVSMGATNNNIPSVSCGVTCNFGISSPNVTP